MSGAAGQGALPGPSVRELPAERPGLCVGPSRSGRGVRRPWGKRWGAGVFRGRGTRRRARSSVRETRCVNADRLPNRRRPWGRRQAAGKAQASGENEAAGTPGAVVSKEAARDRGTVWVNGAVGEPQVVGPVGSVWVTGTGEEETVYRSPPGCERKGRPGSLGHGSILELWLKVQALRAASGGGQRSRVELHPVPAGEGPIERGVPGRASWVETSREGLTGPWVKGQAGADPRGRGLSIPPGPGAGCERAMGCCGQGQAVRMPSVAMPGTLEANSGIAPHLPGRGQAVGVPGPLEGIGYGVAPSSSVKGLTVGVPGVTGWPEAVEVPRAVAGELCWGGAPDPWGRQRAAQVPGALAQGVICGHTTGFWGRGQTAVVHRTAQGDTPSVDAPAVWRRRRAVGETGTRQPVEVPCVIEEGVRCGGDPCYRERGQAGWAETGSGGNSGSWEAAQTAGWAMCGPEEQEAGPGSVPGHWGIGQATGVPWAPGTETGCGCVLGLWGTQQPLGVSQAVGLSGTRGVQTSCCCVPGLWARQQALGVPLAEAVPAVVREETYGGNVLGLLERRQALGEQEAVVPATVGGPGSVCQETGCGDSSCLCLRRQAVGLSELVRVPETAGVSSYRCALAPCELSSGSEAARVPAAVWVSDSVGQEDSSREDWNLRAGVHPARRPTASGVPMAPQELWLAGEDAGLWGRRQSARVPVAAEVPRAPGVCGSLGVETGSGDFSHLPGRRQTAGVSLTAGVFADAGVPVALRAPRPVQELAGSGGVSGLCRERETVWGPMDAVDPTRMGMPTTARVPGPMSEEMGPRGISGLVRGRQSGGACVAMGLHTAMGMPGPVGEEMLSGHFSSLSGSRQTAEVPMAAASISLTVGVPTAAGAPGPLVGDVISGDSSGEWGRRPVTEVPVAARAVGLVDGETGSEGVADPWRRPDGAIPEAARVPLSLGVLAAVGVPMAGPRPAVVWVTGPAGEEPRAAVSDLTGVRRQFTEGPRAPRTGEIGGRNVLALAGRSQPVGVSYTCGHGTRLWRCLRSAGEELDYENVPGVSRTGVTVGENGAEEVPPVSREETGSGLIRDHARQGGRRQAGGESAVRAGGNNLGDSFEGEDRLRGVFH
ncbi:collagen alpha-2(I) chain [Bos taurus]|uniref:collagen alpha-2(I) chain n=1 Tax=Bos taurus TaxID=9913 RepID=UPI0028CB53C1|nr:collagen alpha-2(I) chain [Bos taurus]